MNDDEQGFWNAIADRPADDLPKLVFADWLDERGDPLGQTLRHCVVSGRRPGQFPDGQAFWVTTTSHPVAAGRVRQGRRLLPPASITPQRSWLAAVYWKYLAAEQRAWVLIRSATIWRYESMPDAYRDLCRARRDLIADRFNPNTGRSEFDGLTNSKWRDEALRVITITLAKLPPNANKAKALRDAYPFGERRGWPYKMWLQMQRGALGPKVGAASVVPGAGGCGWCNGKGCVACASARFEVEEGVGV